MFGILNIAASKHNRVWSENLIQVSRVLIVVFRRNEHTDCVGEAG